MYVKLPIVLLALIEASLLIFATYFAAALHFGGDVSSSATPSGRLLPTALLFAWFGAMALFSVGLYSTRQRATTAGILVRVVAAVTTAVALSAFVYYFVPAVAVDRGVLGLMAGIAVCVLGVVRLLFERVVDESIFKRRVLVYGAGTRAASLLELRRRSDQRGFQVIAFVAADGDHVTAAASRLTERPPDLFRWAIQNQVDEVVVAMDDRRRGFPMHEFLECRLAGIDVLELPSFLERETGKVRLDVLSPSWIIFGGGFRASPLQRALERGFDILASLGLLVATLPFMLLAVLAIRVEDGWRAPVLYRQRRVGRYGELFDVLKFRSMTVDAEQGEAIWAVKNDPRVTKVGKRHPQDAHRRAAAAPERAARRNELRRPAPRAARVRRAPRAEDSLLPRAPHREARHHRLGPALLPVRLHREGRAREAPVRPLLRQEPQPDLRPRHPRADGRGGAVGKGRSVRAESGY